MEVDKRFCMASYLQFRYIVDPRKTFKEDIVPTRFLPTKPFYSVKDKEDLKRAIQDHIEPLYESSGDTALMLSGGMDSAILAALVPKGTKAFTFRSNIPGTMDESPFAVEYAKQNGLEHEIIDIDWQDFLDYTPSLMSRKGAPIHSIAVQIYVAAKKAREQGFVNLLFAEGADINFGGLSGLLSKDLTTEDFLERYNFVNPKSVLKTSEIIKEPYIKHTKESIVDAHDFIRDVLLREAFDCYINPCELAGVKFVSPYTVSRMSEPLEIERVRQGENKYIIRELFAEIYPDEKPRKKLPMPRAVDQYLADWKGPTRSEFRDDIDLSKLSGDQKWYVYCLEWFLNIIEGEVKVKAVKKDVVVK